MTAKQAIAAAIKIDPKRIYCAQRQDWKLHFDGAPSKPIYSLFILPGLAGADGQHFRSLVSFRGCVDEYRDALASAAEA